MLDSDYTGLTNISGLPSLDSRHLGFVEANSMRRITRVHKKSNFFHGALLEFISGLSIILFLTFVPPFIKRVSDKSRILTVITTLGGYFLLLTILSPLAFAKYNNRLDFTKLLELSLQLVLGFHYYYIEGVTKLFGENALAYFLKEFGALVGGVLAVFSIYKLFIKKRT